MSDMVQYLILVVKLTPYPRRVLHSCSLRLQPFPSCLYFLAFSLNCQPGAKTSFFHSLSAHRIRCCSHRGFWGNTNYLLYSSVVPYMGLVGSYSDVCQARFNSEIYLRTMTSNRVPSVVSWSGSQASVNTVTFF